LWWWEARKWTWCWIEPIEIKRDFVFGVCKQLESKEEKQDFAFPNDVSVDRKSSISPVKVEEEVVEEEEEEEEEEEVVDLSCDSSSIEVKNIEQIFLLADLAQQHELLDLVKFCTNHLESFVNDEYAGDVYDLALQ
jgi:hypothetical protein